MKRERFEIALNGEFVVAHSKWNACILKIEQLAREAARANNTTYDLVSSESIREGFHFVRGHRTWRSASGDELRFEIQRA